MAINFKRCCTISVVIPTLNEEKNIYSCVLKTLFSPHVCEVVVVDGGSKDRTVELAQKAGAKVLKHCKPYHLGGGRGGQIKAGIFKTSGDVVAIVHADTFVPPKAFCRMITTLNLRPSVIGGAVGCRFRDFAGFKLRVIEFLNDARALFFNISFGDQVQFFRREPVVCYDIFPNMPLMEDVEFSIRLNSFGRQVFLFGKAAVSARRWQRLGFKNSITVILFFLNYLSLRLFNSKLDTSLFYKKYYSS
ncbi:MAG: glycosyltransferase [Desulfamplus sp.]|nr:glycosyltransferase [Desulfamplus sp.]